jgi:hypothetical protein
LADAASALSNGGYVADLTRQELQRLARLGAQSRLEELRREEAAIRRAFPDLFRGRRGSAGRAASSDAETSAAGGRRRRRRRKAMSAAARKAVSERMKNYWAARRKSAK